MTDGPGGSRTDKSKPAFSDGDVARGFLHPHGAQFALRKMARFATLSERETEAVAALADEPIAIAPRGFVHERGERAGPPMAVLSGCLRESFTDAEGRTQTLAFHWPGDIVGMALDWTDWHVFDLDAMVPSRVAPAPFALGHDPEFAALRGARQRMGHFERAVTMARMRVLGRGRAEERLLHLFLEVNARQRVLMPPINNRAWVPFSQTEIANATGMTNVYVSKTLTMLKARGAIEVEHDIITLNDPAAIAHDVDFTDHLAHARSGPPGDAVPSGRNARGGGAFGTWGEAWGETVPAKPR